MCGYRLRAVLRTVPRRVTLNLLAVIVREYLKHAFGAKIASHVAAQLAALEFGARARTSCLLFIIFLCAVLAADLKAFPGS